MVDLYLTPLKEWSDGTGCYKYYSCEDVLIELAKRIQDGSKRLLVLVDGPPGNTCANARYPALPFMSHFISNHEIDWVLDDAYRDEEKLSYVLASNLISGTANGANFITFTTPTSCNNIRITCKRTDEVDSFDNSRTLIVTKGSTILQAHRYGTYIDSLFGYQLKDNTIENENSTVESPLKGLKWVALGDSLTEKNIRTTKNYHDYIADETGVVVVNMGVGGSGYKKREGENKAFYQRVLNTPLDADIVTIFGSGNDLSLTLGTPTDSGTDTLCGCINTTIDNLYSILPTVKLGIITPTPWGKYPTDVVDNKMALYSEAIVEICKRRGIPCLDLYHCSNMRPWDDTFKNLMYKRDDGNSVHPDEDGHKFMYRRFLTFIESL